MEIRLSGSDSAVRDAEALSSKLWAVYLRSLEFPNGYAEKEWPKHPSFTPHRLNWGLERAA
jgi:hypothetical protein